MYKFVRLSMLWPLMLQGLLCAGSSVAAEAEQGAAGCPLLETRADNIEAIRYLIIKGVDLEMRDDPTEFANLFAHATRSHQWDNEKPFVVYKSPAELIASRQKTMGKMPDGKSPTIFLDGVYRYAHHTRTNILIKLSDDGKSATAHSLDVVFTARSGSGFTATPAEGVPWHLGVMETVDETFERTGCDWRYTSFVGSISSIGSQNYDDRFPKPTKSDK